MMTKISVGRSEKGLEHQVGRVKETEKAVGWAGIIWECELRVRQ